MTDQELRQRNKGKPLINPIKEITIYYCKHCNEVLSEGLYIGVDEGNIEQYYGHECGCKELYDDGEAWDCNCDFEKIKLVERDIAIAETRKHDFKRGLQMVNDIAKQQRADIIQETKKAMAEEIIKEIDKQFEKIIDDLNMGFKLKKYNRNIGDYIIVIVKDIVRKTLEKKP